MYYIPSKCQESITSGAATYPGRTERFRGLTEQVIDVKYSTCFV